jgi:flagellar biosynthetic protein FliR
MILALVTSYRVLPMGQGMPIHPMEILGVTSFILSKGYQMAMPVLMILFFVDILEGISGKFMPQLHIIQLSFPIKITVGTLILIAMMREWVNWVMPMLEAAPAHALRLLRP